MPTVVDQDGLTIETSTTGSGTGNYESFLRLAANDEEAGYNTDENGQLQNKDGIWTHDLLISDLSVVHTADGDFYEIRLDLNEIQSGSKPDITLEDLQLFVGDPAGADFVPGFDGRTPVFDLDGSVLLHDTNHGSGTDDYKILIPVSMLTGGDYLTLYAAFSGSDDGFEEFRALTKEFVPTPDIGVLKETDGTDDQCQNLITGTAVTWTYTVENNGNVPLINVTVTDDNGTPGNTADDFLATYLSGDTHNLGVLDTDETWVFTATGTVQAGEYVNVATVNGDWNNSGTLVHVSSFEEDCYFGVTPTISITKLTNDTDNECNEILKGQAVNWTYQVTNTSAAGIWIAGSSIVVTDDAGTPGDTSDDSSIVPTASLKGDGIHNVGDADDNGRLDVGETWIYTASGVAGSGEYENTATVNGTAHDAADHTAPVTDDESDCYFGAAPEIDIVKLTNGTDDLCPVLSVGDTVTWTYNVTNTGNVALDNIQISDDAGSDGVLGDDITPTAVLSGSYNIGDTDNFGVFDPGETWVYTASGTVVEGHYDNVAYVSGDYTDDFSHSKTVYADEDDCYVGVEGPGVRTPGFWANPRNGGQFWDGNYGNEKNAGQDCFAFGDLLRKDTNGNHVLDAGDAEAPITQGGVPGLLIGDWDLNGVQNGTEDTIFISLEAATLLINASQKDQQDGRWVVGRDLVATWLNYLAGNPIGTIDNTDGVTSPKEAIQAGIDFLQVYGDNINHNGILTNAHKIVWDGGAVKQSSPAWLNIGSGIHSDLDEYNNYGTVDGNGYAHSCDHDSFVVNMNGFMTDQGLFMM